MAAPTIASTDITPSSIKIVWAALTTASQTGNCEVSGYLLEWSTTGPWTALTSNTYMLTYFSWTGPYASNTNYNFRVTASNAVGNGLTSTNGTALTDTIPGAANTPTCTASDINPTSVTLNWVALVFGAATGRDTITYYKLEWYD